MKKIVLLLAVAALLVAGCGSSKKAATTTTTSAAPTFKVGLSTDVGGLNDRSFNHLAYKGLLQAEKQLGIHGRVVEAASSGDYVPNLSALARQGYNLIIGVGFTEIQAMQTVAKQYPKSHFAIVDVSNADEGGLPNVEGLLFREQEAGYLAGYAAGLTAKADGKNTVSSVGGQKQPPVDRYIAGFQAGAKAAFPGVQVLNGYSNDFTVQARCKELALNQIAAGSDVVFQVAGGCGLGALDAAKSRGVWGVGVDADQGYLGTYVLTSALKRVDTSVFDAIKDAQSGKFGGGSDRIFSIKENGVGIGKFSSKAPAGVADKVEQVRQEIISGKIKNIPTVVK